MRQFSKKSKQRQIVYKSANPSKLSETSEQKSLQTIPLKNFEYEINLNIDKKELLKNNIKDIEVLIVDKNPEIIAKKKSIFGSKNKLSARQVNKTLIQLKRIRKNNVNTNKNNKRVVAKIETNKILNNEIASKSNAFTNDELFGKKIEFKVIKINKNTTKSVKNQTLTKINQRKVDSKSVQQKILKQKKNKTNFLRELSKNIAKGNIQNKLKMLKGSMENVQSKSNDRSDLLIKQIKDEIVNKSIDSEIQTNYELIKVKKENKVQSINQKIKMNEHVLDKFNGRRKLNLMYIVKNKKGEKIQTFHETINNVFYEKQILAYPDIDFDVHGFRRSNRIFIKITNKGKKRQVFSVFGKKDHPAMPDIYEPYKLINSKIMLQPGQSKTLFRNNPGLNFPYGYDIRVITESESGKVYTNFKTFYVKPVKALPKTNMISGICAKSYSGYIQVQIYDTSNILDTNITSYSLLRKNVSKKERKFKPVLINESNSMFAGYSKNQTEINVKDFTAQEGNVYEYKFKLFDINKQEIICGNPVTVNFQRRSNLIKTITNSPIILDGNFLNINLSFLIEESDQNKLFKRLTGNFYDLFKDDLKKIRSSIAQLINAKITIVNESTGDELELGSFSADDNGILEKSIPYELSSIENTLGLNPYNKKQYSVKIDPRIIPPAVLIDRINALLKQRSAFEVNKEFNFNATAATKQRLLDKQEKIVSKIGNKFNQRSIVTKGLIKTQDRELSDSGFDLYFDGTTGDISYFDIGQNSEYSINSISISKKDNPIIVLKKEETGTNNFNIQLSEKIYTISAEFTILNKFNEVDYIIMSYQEGDTIKHHGLSFPKENSCYIYDNMSGLLGEVYFLATPVHKNGTIMKSVSIGKAIFDSEGVVL